MSTYAWFLAAVATSILPLRWWLRRAGRAIDPRGIAAVLLCVSVPWVLLDAWQHGQGYWAYSPAHVWPAKILGLPLEEVAFFVVVLLVCVVVYESMVAAHFRANSRVITSLRALGLGAVALLTVVAVGDIAIAARSGWSYQRSLIDAVLYVTMLAVVVRFRSLSYRPVFWAWSGVVLVLFVAANTFLAGLPIVTYDMSAMVPRPRVGVVPVADFMYNYSLLWSALVVYVRFARPKA